MRLDGGAGEGARVVVDPGYEEGRVGRGASHHHVVATAEATMLILSFIQGHFLKE